MEREALLREAVEPLLRWYDKNARDLPWRRTRDPYRVWVSEIMLQQTRVEAAIPYYERFLESFPTLQALADAPEERLLKLWEGLGYYSRARNLQKAARQALERFGALPGTASELASLAGIGGCTVFKNASGNIATEDTVYMLNGMGIETGIDLEKAIKAGEFVESLVDPSKTDSYIQRLEKIKRQGNGIE